MKTKIK